MEDMMSNKVCKFVLLLVCFVFVGLLGACYAYAPVSPLAPDEAPTEYAPIESDPTLNPIPPAFANIIAFYEILEQNHELRT